MFKKKPLPFRWKYLAEMAFGSSQKFCCGFLLVLFFRPIKEKVYSHIGLNMEKKVGGRKLRYLVAEKGCKCGC